MPGCVTKQRAVRPRHRTRHIASKSRYKTRSSNHTPLQEQILSKWAANPVKSLEQVSMMVKSISVDFAGCRKGATRTNGRRAPDGATI